MATRGALYGLWATVNEWTLAACPGPSRARLARCFLFLVVLLGCAHRPPAPLTEATKAHLGTIGVVAAPVPLEVDYRTPSRGGAGGAAIGATKGVGLGVLGAVACMGVLGYCAQCVAGCAVAVATPYFAARYAVDQATAGVPADTIDAAETAIQAVLGAQTHRAVLREEVVRLAATHATQSLVALPGEVRPSAFETRPYKHLAADGIDTVIEITLQRLALQSRTTGRARGDTIWRISAAELNPHLTLVVTARTRVLTTTDGTELHGYTRDYTGGGATFTEWGATDAQLLRERLDQLLREMAGAIVAEVFGVDVPPVREPEAPAAPNVEQPPESPAEPSASDAERPMRE